MQCSDSIKQTKSRSHSISETAPCYAMQFSDSIPQTESRSHVNLHTKMSYLCARREELDDLRSRHAFALLSNAVNLPI